MKWVHNSDGHIYFEGKGRREGLGAELYALGLLQSADSLDKYASELVNPYPLYREYSRQ